MDRQTLIENFNQKHRFAKLFIESDTSNRWIIHIEGELDLQSASDTQSVLEVFLEDILSRSEVVFDLEKLVYISSTGVGLFANLIVAANKRRITIVLKRIQPKVEQVFRLLGMLSYFTIAK